MNLVDNFDRGASQADGRPVSDKGTLYTFENALISFPHLKEKHINAHFPNTPPQYSVQVILNKEEVQAFLTALENHIKSNPCLPEPINDNKFFNIKKLEGDEIVTPLKGKYTRTFSSRFEILVGQYDPNLINDMQDNFNGTSEGLRKLTGEEIEKEIYAGCYGHVQICIKHSPTKPRGNYSFYLQQVIKTQEGERLAMRRTELGEGMNFTKPPPKQTFAKQNVDKRYENLRG